MIVDTSAIVAILREELEADLFMEKLVDGGRLSISSASYLEAAIVLDRSRDPVAARKLDEFLKQMGIQISPVTESQAKIARQAYRDFGKGSGHKAQLYFGDCFAYALAYESGEPLLYKGTDFAETGIRPA